jgi:Skp family chaperone for outer membrane proteins
MCLASAVMPEDSAYVKPLSPIPTEIKDLSFYESPDSAYSAAALMDSQKSCLRARSAAYQQLRAWQNAMHAKLGDLYRNSERQWDKEYNATKDPKLKKQLGEWQTKLSEAFAKMNQQVDQEYQTAVNQVHFKIPCSGK